MILTRSKMEEVKKLINDKLDEFKKDILANLQPLIEAEIAAFLKKTNVTPNAEYKDSIEAIKNHVDEIKASQAEMGNRYVMLEKRLEKLEQYTRRPSLRIFGVEVAENETAKDVEGKVLSIINESNIDIDVRGLDRAHRIGRKKTIKIKNINPSNFESTEENGIDSVAESESQSESYSTFTTQPIICRFTTFRDRTKIYRERKEIKKNLKYGIALDLTYERYCLLRNARNHVQNIEGIQFVYADINCDLRAFTAKGQHLRFESIFDLYDIISNLVVENGE